MTVGRQARARLGGAGEAIAASGLALVVGALALVALERAGIMGLLLPLAGAGALMLLRWPTVAVFGAVGMAILGEGGGFELLTATQKLYIDLGVGVMPIDLLFVIATVAVVLRLLREHEPLLLPPRLLSLGIALLLLAIAGGMVVAHAAGIGTTTALLATHKLMYVALVPLLVVNLRLDERKVKRVLVAAGLLAMTKAVLGLMAFATGRGLDVDGSVLTYYQPVANWLTMLTALVAIAALVLRARPPLWLLTALPLVTASLLLSYRRSFWIGFALAVLAVLLLGLSPLGRRLIVPIVALLAAAVWMLGSIAVQSDSPLAQRVQSLSPTKVTTKAEDRYRLDERANVLAELRAHPLTGLGLEVPWHATVRTLPVEVNPEHTYVHNVSLYWWLKLGLLGLLALVVTMASAFVLSFRVWRRAREPLLRAVGLASLCGLTGLLAIETTGSFTGVDLRFTVAFGAQLGLLAVLARQATDGSTTEPAGRSPAG